MTENAPPRATLRQRKKLATREALSWSALSLALEHGPEAVRVEDIAAAAEVSPRTFNNYFASKYEAICAITTDRARRISAAMRRRPADEPLWDVITESILEQYASVDDTPTDDDSRRDWSSRSQDLFHHPVLRGEYLRAREVLHRSLSEAITERLGSTHDLVPAVTAAAALAAADTAIARWRAAKLPLHDVMRGTLREAGQLVHTSTKEQ
ncbi:MAG: TetR/AcrR family transcriptional regulator [Stackebrandtia sp.]